MNRIAVGSRPLSNPKLHQRVVEEILTQIVSGTLPAGSMLPSETELAHQFGVSRIVIREAIRILVAKGLITVRHGSGMWVQPLDQWDLLDPMVLRELVHSTRQPDWIEELLEFRKILDITAAELAAQRRNLTQLAHLEDLLQRMQTAVEASDTSSYAHLDLAFHEAILESAGNRLLREALRPLSEIFLTSWGLTMWTPERIARVHAGHERILRAIAAGDSAAAREAMHSHLDEIAAIIREDLKLERQKKQLPDERT